MSKLKLTLVKSLIGSKSNQILTAHSLELKKVGNCKIVDNNEPNQGKIRVISHLIKVEEVE